MSCPICRARLGGAADDEANDGRAVPVGLVELPSAEPGSYEKGPATHRSLQAFVADRRERLYSRERDFGLRWRDGGALYRAAWIADTGEFYLVQLGAPSSGGGHVELVARGLEVEELESALAGWSDAQDAGEHSLDWLRERVLPLTRARIAA